MTSHIITSISAKAPMGPWALEIIKSDWQHESKLKYSNYHSLDDSKDANFIVFWVHCGWQVFNVAVASGPWSFSYLRALRSQLLTLKFLLAFFGHSIHNWACTPKSIPLWLYIQFPSSKWATKAPREETELVASASVMKYHHIPGQCIRKHRRINAEQLDSNELLHGLRRPLWTGLLWKTCFPLEKFTCSVFRVFVFIYFFYPTNWGNLFYVLLPRYYWQYSNTKLPDLKYKSNPYMGHLEKACVLSSMRA